MNFRTLTNEDYSNHFRYLDPWSETDANVFVAIITASGIIA